VISVIEVKQNPAQIEEQHRLVITHPRYLPGPEDSMRTWHQHGLRRQHANTRTPRSGRRRLALGCLLPAAPGLGRLFRSLGGHAGAMTVRSVGVEEELLLVEPQTGQPRAVAGTVLQAAQAAAESGDSAAGAAGHDAAGTLDFELQQQQLETNTRPCRGLEELGREVRRCRAWAAEAAQRAGVRVVALATSPVPAEPEVVAKSRYQEMAAEFGLTAQELLTCGCHVHVEISSADEGVAALDRIGPWLAILLALSADSPFWQGRDSGYASFRYQAWNRWPSSGPTAAFGAAEAYQDTVRQMVATQTVLDPGMVYFDARLSQHQPTLEIRVADVCLHADDTVLIAALARALVETAARHWREQKPAPSWRAELLRLAAWRASRSGLDDALLSPVTGRPEQAPAVAAMLLDHAGDALADAGDSDTAADLLAAILARGTGAAFQRDAYRHSSHLPSVATTAAAITAR
jgi:carboxylate-amine ligase